ncbi:glycosyltransferase family 4 protein [Shewanella sp. VB17]|uniref:glycosyltransferase family 4 protein n=1 Tax=Shewanella sp. VB17 TaxID=2739432 RepID=UPI0015664816|nr:glycosyltransferase family 4 protein [Shewanella sp. VB17]NRD74699.1 glycosyltransferase family 4 protein [Shewanella sp. VB17]
MNILYLHQYFATPNSNAGTRSYEMAKRFVEHGHSVTFVTTSALLSSEYSFSKGWNVIHIEGIKLHVLHLAYSNKDSFIKRIFKFVKFAIFSTLKSLSLKVDVVLATSTPLTIAVPGLVYSKIKNKPLVFEVRDLWPELPVAVGAIKNPVVIKLAEWFEAYTYKNSSRVVGLSPGMCAGIVRHGVDESRVTLATNSCDTDLFDVDASIGIRYKDEHLSFVGDRKLVVYTGTFGLINNVEYLVFLANEMQNEMSDVCFVAIGDGMMKEQVIAKAKELGVYQINLYILPPVPKTEIIKLLSAADLALSLFGPIPEMWHNSANKLFDALASVTPIAINYGGWQKEFIDKYNCGIVLDSDDYTKSAHQISKFLNEDIAYSYAKKQCVELAYNHFSRNIMAAKLEKTLQDATDD